MDEIRSVVFRRSIRIQEFFEDFDKLRSGFITFPQFERCMSQLGIRLEKDGLLEVKNGYCDEKGKFNYVLFSRDVNRIFFISNLEKQPHGLSSHNPQDLLKDTVLFNYVSHPELSEEEENLLMKLKFQCDKRGYIIRECYKDFDKSNVGIVTCTQFVRGLPFLGLRNSEIESLIKRYSDESGYYFNYVKFSEEVNKIEKLLHLQGSAHSGVDGEDDDDSKDLNEFNNELMNAYLREKYAESEKSRVRLHLQGVEEKVKRLVSQHRIRLKEPFHDFDPLRKGFVTPAQFKSVLGTIKFPKESLSGEELDLLCSKFQMDDLRVDYVRFLRDLDSIFFSNAMEKDPFHEFVPAKIEKTEKALYKEAKNAFVLDEDEKNELNDILEEIRYRVRSERILLKQLFIDFDKATKTTRSYHISYARFNRALASLGFKFNQTQYALLCKAFDDLLTKDKVNFVKFIDTVEDKNIANSMFG